MEEKKELRKFIITWDAGFGEMADVVEAESEEEADKMAYEYWRQDAEDNAVYGAEPYTKERALDLSVNDELVEEEEENGDS